MSAERPSEPERYKENSELAVLRRDLFGLFEKIREANVNALPVNDVAQTRNIHESRSAITGSTSEQSWVRVRANKARTNVTHIHVYHRDTPLHRPTQYSLIFENAAGGTVYLLNSATALSPNDPGIEVWESSRVRDRKTLPDDIKTAAISAVSLAEQHIRDQTFPEVEYDPEISR